jgi:hypothetical protein
MGIFRVVIVLAAIGLWACGEQDESPSSAPAQNRFAKLEACPDKTLELCRNFISMTSIDRWTGEILVDQGIESTEKGPSEADPSETETGQEELPDLGLRSF